MSEGEAPSTIKHHSGMSLNQYLKEANDQINVLKSQVEFITRNNNDVEIQAIRDDTLGAPEGTLFAERSKYNFENPSKVSLGYVKPKKIRLLSVVTFNGSNIVKDQPKDNSLSQMSSKYKLPSAAESQPQRKRGNFSSSLSPGGIFRGNALTIQKPQVVINKPLILQTPLTEVKYDEYYEKHRNRASQLQKRIKEDHYYKERLENKAIAYLDQVSERVTQQNTQVKNKNDNLKRLIEGGPPFLLTGPATIRNNEMKYMTINPNKSKVEIDEYPMVKKVSSKKAIEQLNKLSAITRNSIYNPEIKTSNQPKRIDVIKLPNIYNYDSLNFDFTEQHIILSPKLNSPKNINQPMKTNFANYLQNLDKPMSNLRELSNPRPPYNPQQHILGPPHLRHKKTKSHLAHYNETSSLIVESLLLSEPDDLSKLQNGGRLDRTGLFSNFPLYN